MNPCDIDDDECLGTTGLTDLGPRVVSLCEYHRRALGELGERAFHEWYSNELPA